MLIVVIVLTVGACFFAAEMFFSVAVDRNSIINRIIGRGHTETVVSLQEQNGSDGTKKGKSWFEKTAEDVYITSDDGLKLHGYLAENEKSGGKYVIVFHGYTSEGSHMKKYVKRFYDLGYGVLALDARAHGASEGDICGMGWLERKDALRWIDMLIQKNVDCKIVLFGVSMGGATVMMTAGEEELPSQVVAGIEDCGYTSVWDEFGYRLKKMFRLPSFPILNLASLITKWRGGYDFKEASAIEQVKKCSIPMLFIHGEKDKFVPFSMLDKLYNAAECDKRKLIIPGAGHTKSASTDPDTYWGTVEEFLGGYLPKK